MAYSPFWWSGRPQHHPLTFSSVKRQSLGVEIERDGGGQRGRGHLCPSSQGFCIRFWSLIVHPKGPKHTFSPPKALYWQQVHHNLHILFQLWGFLGLVSQPQCLSVVTWGLLPHCHDTSLPLPAQRRMNNNQVTIWVANFNPTSQCSVSINSTCVH